MDILAAIDDRNLLGASIRDPDSWKPWRALLAACFSLPPSCFASARGGLCRLGRPPRICGLWSGEEAENPSPWL
jgi:hypothetical protein